MARGRMINQTVSTDKRLNELSIDAELLYLKTIPHLDRDGLILGEPMLLWAKVCPRRPNLMQKVGSLIQEWVDSGLVVAYTDNGDTILFFTGFAKNQVGMRYNREPVSTYAPPPGYKRSEDGLVSLTSNIPQPAPTPDSNEQEDDRNSDDDDGDLSPEECRKNAGRMPEECPPNRIEENRKEKNGASSPPLISTTGDPFADAARAKFARNGRITDSWQAELNLRLAATKRVPLVNAIGKACGLTALMNGNDGTLRDVHDTACWFFESGYDSPEKIEALHKVYLTDEWRRKSHPKPSLAAFTKFASAQLDELPVVAASVQSTNWSAYGGGMPDYMKE